MKRHVGSVIGLTSAKRLSEMLETERLAVFGESVAARQARKAGLTELNETEPDAYFDIDAVERKPR